MTTDTTTKRRMPSEAQIRAHWREWIEARIDDPDEGVCFACEMIEPCERAHILARADGGADDVGNLHMLCHDCHEVSEHLSGDRYWQWIDGWNFVERATVAAMGRGVPLASLMQAAYTREA